jgi:Glyoxalase-like domain
MSQVGRKTSAHQAPKGCREDGVAPAVPFLKVLEAKIVKNRVHVDLSTADAAADTERLAGLGATVLHVFEEDGKHRWTTFADPEGNEFDLVSI